MSSVVIGLWLILGIVLTEWYFFIFIWLYYIPRRQQTPAPPDGGELHLYPPGHLWLPDPHVTEAKGLASFSHPEIEQVLKQWPLTSHIVRWISYINYELDIKDTSWTSWMENMNNFNNISELSVKPSSVGAVISPSDDMFSINLVTDSDIQKKVYYPIRCETSDNVCLGLHKCRYSVFSVFLVDQLYWLPKPEYLEKTLTWQ